MPRSMAAGSACRPRRSQASKATGLSRSDLSDADLIVTDMPRTQVAIVGAGPAGLIAAIAAAQRGITVTVFEAAEDFSRVGGGVVVHSNGLSVLARLGLLKSFEPSIFPCRKLVLELADR